MAHVHINKLIIKKYFYVVKLSIIKFVMILNLFFTGGLKPLNLIVFVNC